MKEKNKILAGIVTFNPNITVLKKNIDAIIMLLDTVYIVDNGSTNVEDIENLIKNFKLFNDQNIILYKSNMNHGIAKALNIILSAGKNMGYQWVLTLDQDSIVPKNIIDSNLEILNYDKNIAIISAVIKDRNEKHKKVNREDDKLYSEVNYSITSSSLTSIYIWNRIGGFDEYMFIDDVDIEYCIRARQKGYKILRNNTVVLSHAIGNITEVNFMGKWITIRNHSAFRKYYQIRNLFYMSKKLYNRILIKVWLRIIIAYFKVILFENDRKNKIKAMNKGLMDGIIKYEGRVI